MNEIVKINHEEFGIEETKAKQIAEQFKPMLDKMAELESEFNLVASLDIELPETSKKAKELRLKYVKVRTGTADIHKEQKAFYLQAGRFIDGWKNAQIFASQGIEEKLEQIEKYAENKEKERLKKINEERILLLAPYVDNADNLSLHEMDEDVWSAYLSTKKQQYNDKIEAEKKAEEKRLADIKKQEEEREYQRLENIRLKKEAEEREQQIKKEREDAEKEANKKAAENEERLRKEREEREAIEAEKRRVEEELKQKKEQEQRKEKERLELEEQQRKEAIKLAKAPVKKQLNVWIESFELPDVNIDNDVCNDIISKFDSFKKWCLERVESI